MVGTQEMSEWMVERFGDDAAVVASVAATAGLAAHDRSYGAKAESRLPTNEAYGAVYWLALPDEFATAISTTQSACFTTVRPSRSRYDLVVHNETLIFPVKILDEGTFRPDSMHLRPSELRREIFDLSLHDPNQPSLFGDENDSTSSITSIVPATLGGEATSMVLIAYMCNPLGGLQHIYIGDAALDDDGLIIWLHREELPITNVTVIPGLTTAAEGSFDNASLPRPTLELVTDETTGSDDNDHNQK